MFGPKAQTNETQTVFPELDEKSLAEIYKDSPSVGTTLFPRRVVTTKDTFERRLFDSLNVARMHPRVVAECLQQLLKQPRDNLESNPASPTSMLEVIEQLQTAPSLPLLKYNPALTLACADCLASYKSIKDRLDAPHRPPVLDAYLETRGVVVFVKGVFASYCKGTPEEFVLNLVLNKDNKGKLYDPRCDVGGIASREDQCLGSLVLFCNAQSKPADTQTPTSSPGCPPGARSP